MWYVLNHLGSRMWAAIQLTLTGCPSLPLDRHRSSCTSTWPSWLVSKATAFFHNSIIYLERLFKMLLFHSADDWLYSRPSNQYSMGDMIKIQVSVMQYYHVPLRVYVDSCIATASYETSSNPSYVFIDQGCGSLFRYWSYFVWKKWSLTPTTFCLPLMFSPVQVYAWRPAHRLRLAIHATHCR